MAVKHRIVSASTGKTVRTAPNAGGQSGSALPLRLAAVVLWIFAIAFEVLALCAMTEKIVIPFLVKLSPLVQGIVLHRRFYCRCCGCPALEKSEPHRTGIGSECAEVLAVEQYGRHRVCGGFCSVYRPFAFE